MQTLNEIYIYPIKSAGPICLVSSDVEEKGLQFDRRYMLIDEDGKFITGRTHPQLTQIKIKLISGGLVVDAPEMEPLMVLEEKFSGGNIISTVWSDEVAALHCNILYDIWFSVFLNKRCQLVFCGESTERFVKRKETQVSFADGYPLLLINQRSLDQFNARLNEPVSALHFRPNLVVNGDFPFVEDSWDRIKIGEVEFEVSKPCGRCPFINVDPKTGIAAENIVLDTLAEFRYFEGSIDFGQNLIALNGGVIKEGDELQVISTKGSPYYGNINDNKTDLMEDLQSDSSNVNSVKVKDLNSGVEFEANDYQVLLEQLESADINLPYSCRGGHCGYCKVQLVEGKVKTLNDQGLSDKQKADGYILPCSCIPQSDLVIG